MPEFNVTEFANNMREKLKELEEIARAGIAKIKSMPSEDFGNKSETIAQATLGMRHTEDARTKYGKIIQYTGDRESVYDKAKENALGGVGITNLDKTLIDIDNLK